ncbi:hypothetical protein C1645_826242 [Glomus cerebriforme]|uniref:Uncharacterized protein n=1 Tax=Glomus cerebriforme TaxID=658196 RepID=A0A397SS25_9GLOM|nr:hypothetical protein C1645_826242 [Glomus cerebriforme]
MDELQIYLIKNYEVEGRLLSALKRCETKESQQRLLKRFLHGTLTTFYVQKYNDEGKLLDIFEEYSMRDQNEFNTFWKEKEMTWSQIEDQAMEKETLQAVEKALCENMLASSLKIFNKQILFDSKKNPIMEFDGIIICDSEFPEKLKIAIESDQEFLELSGKSYIGFVCSTKFPEKLRDLSKSKGFIAVFPSGNRYKVEIPEKLSTLMKKFIKELVTVKVEQDVKNGKVKND